MQVSFFVISTLFLLLHATLITTTTITQNITVNTMDTNAVGTTKNNRPCISHVQPSLLSLDIELLDAVMVYVVVTLTIAGVGMGCVLVASGDTTAMSSA